MTTDARFVSPVTCLGCGCACDDIELRIRHGAIVAAERACDLGRRWFGDGRVPARATVDGQPAPVDAALDAAARALADATRPLVYLAPELSCDAQRAGVALADGLRAAIDSVTTATTLRGLLAAQERGRASATLGEIRHRADLVIGWGVDPSLRYPRYGSRYAPDARGIHVPEGRRSRTVVAVDIGGARGPLDADHRVAVDPVHEVALLAVLAAQEEHGLTRTPPVAVAAAVESLSAWLRRARYVAIVADAEPDLLEPQRDEARADGLVALSIALNARARCALSLLRAGGNRSGADAVLTWQTGYPAAVDFSRGYPRYDPHRNGASGLLERGEIDVVLLLGASGDVPPEVASRLSGTRALVIGPRASEAAIAAHVVIDTGVPGVHHGGIAVRMDDVPLALEAPLEGPPSTETIVLALTERIVTTQGRGP